jgi:3-methyl-2-oxobutanoate hydroxymethyltransferase
MVGRITLLHLQTMKQEQNKIAMVTLYDASLARTASEAGVDILFIGDSLGMVLKGARNTLSVSVSELAYHTRCVTAGNLQSLIMTDLPFMSYYTPELAAKNSKILMQSGAEIVKLEGSDWLQETVYFLAQRGIPVCAHIGLTPQFIYTLGGFKVQGRLPEQAQQLLKTAICLEQAGAHMLVVECVPYTLGQKIAQAVKIPVIGIGAGPHCDGQVLVIYDLLGITLDKPKKFARNFLKESTDGIQGALKSYVTAVRQNLFPSLEQSFQ